MSKMNLKTMKKTTKSNLITYAMVIVIFAVVQILVATGSMSSLLEGLMVPLCMYAIMAVSLNLTVGILGELSLGHAGFMSVGAFAGVIASQSLLDVVPSAGLRLTIAMIVGALFATIAGFIALCFMSFTLGRDLGIVMAKGVLLGVLGCVTILPSLILVLDKPLQRTRHKSLIPDMGGFAKGVCKIFPVFLVIFALLIAPAYISYDKTNDEVYYDMGQCLSLIHI